MEVGRAGGGGGQVGKGKYTQKASALESDLHGAPPTTTSKKMEPGPYFNIKHALNGFTYNLFPKDQEEMQSRWIISVSVINPGSSEEACHFSESVTTQDHFCPALLPSCQAPTPRKVTDPQTAPRGEGRRRKKSCQAVSHTRQGLLRFPERVGKWGLGNI